MDVPLFHTRGREGDDFYALAYVVGRYAATPSAEGEDAFLVLNWTPSPDFTQFTYATVRGSDGSPLSYHRGRELLDTLDYALLRYAQEEGVPAYLWRLYPSAHVDETTFPSPGELAGYRAARRRLCVLVHQSRVSAAVALQSPCEPLFRPAARSVPDPYAATDENREMEAIVDEELGIDDADD